MSRYLIMAGGTGGHIFPAMAVANQLRENGAEVNWLGTNQGMENQLVPNAGFELHQLSVKGFRGKSNLGKLKAPFLLLLAIYQAAKIIRKLNPDVVIGFGGYVSAPGGIAAKLLGKPLIIHEQNSVAGSTNKLLAKLTSHVLEAFPGSLPKALWVGNPVRKSIQSLFGSHHSVEKGTQKRLLITGGSLGAEAINQIVPKALAQLPLELRPSVWHQTGKGKLGEVSKNYSSNQIEAKVEEFITDVESAYQWADVIICRAGALTVSEIAVAGVPAIFIPYPYAIDNHQYSNAQWLAENDAAYVIEQKALTVEDLAQLLTELMSNDQKLMNMNAALQNLATPNATEKVVAVCEKTRLGENYNAA